MSSTHQATALIVGLLVAITVMLIGIRVSDTPPPPRPADYQNIPTCDNGGRSDCGKVPTRDV